MNFIRLLVFAASIAAFSVRAADVDVTGLVPTIWWDFETQPAADGLTAANKGSASITFTHEGTKTYSAGAIGGTYAIDTSRFTPYSDEGQFTRPGAEFTVSAVMTLGTKANGLTLNVANVSGQKDFVIRRGESPGSLVVGVGPYKSAPKELIATDIEGGDEAFHLISIVAQQSGTTLYVDGKLAGSTTMSVLSGSSGCAGRLQFGSRLGGAQKGESKGGGLIDDLRIYDSALTQEQMLDLAIECKVLVPDGFIAIESTGAPVVKKDSFSSSWNLLLAPGSVADAAVVFGTDEALSSPATNAIGSALAAGEHAVSLAGLASGTTYWWKIVASNGVEWAESEVASFRTLDEIDTSSFIKRIPFAISGYTGASTLAEFPVLVKLAAGSPAGFDYADCADGGADIRFADKDGTVIPHEVESWNPDGVSCIWVRVPRLAGVETGFSLYYNAVVPDLPAVVPSDVWSRYVAVVHGGGGLFDSSPKSLEVQNGGCIAVADDAGVAGGGIRKAINKSVGVNIANPVTVLSNSGKFSVSAWYNRNGNGNGNGTHILSASRSGWNTEDGFAVLQEAGSHISVAYKGGHNWSEGSGVLTNLVWGHVAFAYDSPGAMLKAYFNGNVYQEKSNPATLVNTSGSWWTFGSFANSATDDSFCGDMDEIRVFDGVASDDWIRAEHDSVVNSAAFAVAGAAEWANPEAPVVSSLHAEIDRSDAEFSVAISNVRAETAVSVFYSVDGSSFTELPLGTLAGDGTLSAVAPAFPAGTHTWYVRAAAVVDGIAYVTQSPREKFSVSFAKEPVGSYNKFTATISHSGEPVAGVPVLIRFSEEGIEGFRYADLTETLFECVDMNGNILPWEIDTLDTNGVSCIWVKVPSFENGATVTVRYGGEFVNACPPATEIWNDYIGVWHMSEPSGVIADATGNGLVASPRGDVENSVALPDGPVGNARRTASVKNGYLSIPNYDSYGAGDTFTVSGWVKFDDCTGYPRLFSRKKSYSDGNGWEIEMSNGSTENFSARGCGNSPAYAGKFNPGLDSGWSHLAFVYQGATLTVYQNGVEVQSGAITPATDNGLTMSIGCDSNGDEAFVQGAFDECRLMGIDATAERVAAEYAAMVGTHAVSYGEAVLVDKGDPRISVPVVERLPDGTFRVTAEISQNAPAEGSVKCIIGGTEFAMATTDLSLPATYTAIVSGIPAGTCTAIVRAQSPGGMVSARPAATPFYFGALEVSKVCDADETLLLPGIFRISRADADATGLPALTFDVAFSGPALAAIVEPTVASLTIPAGAASVDISVTPIYTTEVDADVALTLSVSGAFVGTPSSGSITIVNATYNPAVRYVATTGDDANHGGTPESPKKTIGAAISSLRTVVATLSCTVHVAPGLYPISSPVVVTNAIAVIGDDPDPSRTVVSNTFAINWNNQNKRVFYIAHPQALIANLTMQNGQYYYSSSGGNFYIGPSGGMVSNCVIEAGLTDGNATAGGAWLQGGVVTHSIFRRNRCNSGSANWDTSRAGVLRLNNSSRAENCLFVDNPQNTSVVLMRLDDTSAMLNCTIADTGLAATNEYCAAWSSLQIAGGATARNVVIAGVTNIVDGAPCPPTWTKSRFLNGAFDGDVAGLPEGTVSGSKFSFFKDYANGDFVPKTAGPLVNAGVDYDGMSATDLAGKARKIGKGVDIGCYEGSANGMFIYLR